MSDLSSGVNAMVRAILAYECDDLELVGAPAIEGIRAGLLGDWVLAIAASGMLSQRIVIDVERAWRFDPELLVDALLDGADEVTRRRLKTPRVHRPESLPVTVSALG